MRDGVDKEEGISRPEVYFDGAFDSVQGCEFARLHFLLRKLGVVEVRLVAAGHDHGGAISGPDVAECHEDVDLSAGEVSVVVAVLGAFHAGVSAGVHANRFAWPAQVCEIFIDEKRAV